MRRRQGETILIGENIRIHIAHIGRARVKIAIDAPRELRVVAKEVEDVERQNRAAAESSRGLAVSAAIARYLEKKSRAAPPVR
ncbi:MAG: carbon storage regulator [Bryobacteraceae bacterium]